MRRYGIDPDNLIFREYGYILKTPITTDPHSGLRPPPSQARISPRLTHILHMAVKHPFPAEWRHNPVCQASEPWPGGPAREIKFPPVTKQNWCLSLGLTLNLDATSASCVTNTELISLLHTGSTPKDATFSIWLLKSEVNAPEPRFSLTCTVRGNHQFGSNVRYEALNYGHDLHIHVQIYPQAGWILLELNHTYNMDVWCDPFEFLPTETISFGNERLLGSIRDFWLTPTPASETT